MMFQKLFIHQKERTDEPDNCFIFIVGLKREKDNVVLPHP